MPPALAAAARSAHTLERMGVNVPAASASARLKIISIGDPGVGKSCLIKRYCEDKFVSKHIATIGIDFGVKPVNIERVGAVRVNFFDFAGGPEYFEIRNEFYKDAQGVVLIFDVGSRASLDALDKWLREGKDYGLKAPAMVLVGNKTDSSKREVSEADAKRWASAHGSLHYFETSAKDGSNVAGMFDHLFAEASVALRF